MADPLCTLMGMADILAGILIMVSFTNTFGIIFGLIMLIKGGFSFV